MTTNKIDINYGQVPYLEKSDKGLPRIEPRICFKLKECCDVHITENCICQHSEISKVDILQNIAISVKQFMFGPVDGTPNA